MPKQRLCILTTIGAVLAGSASAQTSAGTGPTSTIRSSNGSSKIEEVIVTATKRSQSVQKIPAAITAFSSATIKTLGIRTLEDVTSHAPGMSFYKQSGSNFVTLRGVGVPVDTGASDTNTAINVDGVNLPRSPEGSLDLNDIDRVEVLRGPQGTLYGRNATAGAVNFISRKPTDYLTGEIGASVGNFSTSGVHGFVSGPITDKLDVRLSASHDERDQGYVKNLYTGGTFDKSNIWNVRGSLAYKVSDTIHLDLSAQYQREVYDSYQQLMGGTINIPGTIGSPIGSGGLIPVSQTPGLLYTLKPWEIYSAFANPSVKQTVLLNSTLTWDVAEDIHFKSTTGLDVLTNKKSLDGNDVVPTSEVLPGNKDGYALKYETPSTYFSQEFDLTGEFGHRGTWVAGTFFSDERYSTDIPIYLPLALGYNTHPSDPILGTNFAENFLAHQHEQTAAVFGDVTIPVTTNIRLYGGLRYAMERNDTHYATGVYIVPNPPAVQQIGGCDVLSGGKLPASPAYNQEWHPITPRAGLQYDITDQITAYVQWSKGFKDGGASPTGCGNTFQPEYLTAYEAGIKSTFFDKRLQINAAIYRYDYSGMQIYQGIGAAQSQVVNADTRINGLDVEAHARITDIFSADVASSFLDDYFTRFASVDASDPLNTRNLPTILVNGVPTPNLKGYNLPSVPNYTINTGLQAVFPIPTPVFNRMLARLEANFVGRTDTEEWDRPQTNQNAYVKLNAIVTLFSDAYGITLRGFGRNLNNKATTFHFLFNGAANIYSGEYAPPRTFGFELDKSF